MTDTAVRPLTDDEARPVIGNRPLTSAQVMDHLGISRATFWKYARQYPRQFRTYVSGRWRVMDVEDLERWKRFKKELDAA